MKPKELKNLRKKYVELRENLIKTLENSDYEIDVDGDDVDLLQGQSLIRVQNQISANNIKKLRAIDAAIESIDDGEYGDCQDCGEPIGIKRLEAIPGVCTCIGCAEKAELHR
jgi:DnaK suppressor protein